MIPLVQLLLICSAMVPRKSSMCGHRTNMQRWSLNRLSPAPVSLATTPLHVSATRWSPHLPDSLQIDVPSTVRDLEEDIEGASNNRSLDADDIPLHTY
jgi:hypothetical protein